MAIDLDKYVRKIAQVEEDRSEILSVEVGGETFEFHKLSPDKFQKIMGELQKMDGDVSDSGEVFRDLIYFCLPDLHDQAVLDAAGVTHPPDAVAKVFSPEEITALGAELLEFNGFTKTDTVKKL